MNSERLIHSLTRSLDRFRHTPDTISKTLRVTQLDLLTTESRQVLEMWAHDLYCEIMDTPDTKRKEHRDALLEQMVCRLSAREMAASTTLLLKHTDGFGRGEWVPEYIQLLMVPYVKHDPVQAQQFFRTFWSALHATDAMPWLSAEVKHGIIEGLKPYVSIRETFESTTVTYSQARAIGSEREVPGYTGLSP